jgi:1,4-alpha-glucan branching enzyme
MPASASRAAIGAREASRLTEHDIYLFKEGTHAALYEKLGAFPGDEGTWFAVWAPNAEAVSIIGEFNEWRPEQDMLAPRSDSSGIWEGFVRGARIGHFYKCHVKSRYAQEGIDKGDPFARSWEKPPGTSSRIWSSDYEWGDDEWMSHRQSANALDRPISVYEVHLGSWRRDAEGRMLGYRELAHELADYVAALGFTHVEILPVMEHPFYGSWGYQTTGYFAPTARHGDPEDFMYLVDHLHQRGIGVILDWVPSHFPNDPHGLAHYDGTQLYEHADPRQGYHPEWNSCIFNYGRNEVRAFLLSSACFWLDRFHADGIRVDAVASMLYLDYGRREGEWIPNRFGGNENLDAVDFLRKLNQVVYAAYPDVQMIAEESTAWPMISRPTYVGGLGFGMKWNMGWMHDTLDYVSKDPIHRRYHHGQLTFSLWYAFSENFMLPLSHDEVVHGKGSLLNKMPGDDWHKAANVRLLFGYMYAHPGKKLLFMGDEFGQWQEWGHEGQLHWEQCPHMPHAGIRDWVRDLNAIYRQRSSLHAQDFTEAGFEWIDAHDSENSVIAFLRKGGGVEPPVLVVCNFTPVARENYRVGVPTGGAWQELLNSDSETYGGSGVGNFGRVEATPVPKHGHFHSIVLSLPPLGVLYLCPDSASGA